MTVALRRTIKEVLLLVEDTPNALMKKMRHSVVKYYPWLYKKKWRSDVFIEGVRNQGSQEFFSGFFMLSVLKLEKYFYVINLVVRQ